MQSAAVAFMVPICFALPFKAGLLLLSQERLGPARSRGNRFGERRLWGGHSADPIIAMRIRRGCGLMSGEGGDQATLLRQVVFF